MTPLTAPPPPRSPWQLLYGAGHKLRAGWYHGRAVRLPRPVVSVGNLHWGGTGKTPMVAAIATHLRDSGAKVVILSRGYGRNDERRIQLVSDGEGPLLGPSRAGDEPVFLAGELPGVAVVVGADRVAAGRHAMMRLPTAPDVFVLDDGFSHLRLRRDVDLLVFPAADPFAGGRLPPAGRLREPLASSARADGVILTSTCSEDAASAGDELSRALRPYGYSGPGWAAQARAGMPRFVLGDTAQPGGAAPSAGDAVAAGSRVLVVTGIARPERFRDTVQQLGFDVADHLVFSDHHGFPVSSLERIHRIFHQSGATVVLATGKDRVKLQGRLGLPLAEVPIHAVLPSSFFDWLDGQLANAAAKGP